ncbi:MAG TPA: DUF3786 domain-containing protein [Dehalococcoidia bacterium]|nr:DUF3786 domain-containing protein [Dehalococcoidia bacterium]
MELKDDKLVSLHQVEGVVSPHQRQVEGAVNARKEALEYVADVSKLAEFIGGKVESLGFGEDWAISKEVFPGVQVLFIFNHADEEFPSNLKVLFRGDRIKLMKGEDLAGFVILYLSHMLRYVRESNPGRKLPEVCYRV